MRPGQKAPDNAAAFAERTRLYEASMRPGQKAPDNDMMNPNNDTGRSELQ